MSNHLLSTLLHLFTHRLMHVCSFVAFFVDTCYEIHPLLCHLPCSFSRFHILTTGLALPVFYTTTVLSFQRCFFKRQILFTLTNHYHYHFILFISLFFCPNDQPTQEKVIGNETPNRNTKRRGARWLGVI